MKLFRSANLLAPIAILFVIPNPLLASSLKEGIALVSNIGLQAGKLYCSGVSAQGSFEKGAIIGLADTNMALKDVNELDFEDDTYSLPMVESMFSYAIDNCPGRAKSLFRSITEMD